MLTFIVAVIAYVIIGAVAGILGGLLGIGGGVVTVPCLLLIFRYLDFPQAYLMHIAIGTSLGAMIFNTVAATWAHNRRGAVIWKIVKKMVPGFVIGSILGALIATVLSGILLQVFFGIFLCLLGIHFSRGKIQIHAEFKLPSPLILGVLSTGIGAISNVLGIGGGTMTVPLLSLFKVNDKSAIGTSVATTLILTTIGTISYLILGWSEAHDGGNIGFVNLPAFFVVGLASFFVAPFGAKLAHELSAKKVRRIFAAVVIFIGLFMIFF